MKVLQINCVYQYGSTGKITCDIHQFLLSQGIESVVCYGRGERTTDPGVFKLCSEGYAKVNNLLSRIRGTPYGGCRLATRKLIRMIEKEKPDIVHLQCINGHFVNIYALVSWLKDSGIQTVLTLHAEFMYTANCGYALDCRKWMTGCGDCPRLHQATGSWRVDGTAKSFRQMQAAFQGFEKNLTVVSVSPWLRQRAERSPMLRNMEHCVILNGVDTTVFTYKPNNKRRMPGEKIIFHATAMFTDDPQHLKGGYSLLELAKRLRDLPVRFLVAGKDRISTDVPENVTLLGEIRSRELLAEYYSAADLTLLTSRRETFSMVCAESLCCGTPVVGFEAGAPEGITIPEYSRFVPAGKLDGLETAVRQWLHKDVDKTRICADAAKKYSCEKMAREYLELYRGRMHEASR